MMICIILFLDNQGDKTKIKKGTRHTHLVPFTLNQGYISTFAYLAFASMKALRGGTSSPISIENT
jgi:hypothetical protein